MIEISKCGICGEPMPEGETMFKFHGYSGPCPKPALPTVQPGPIADVLATLHQAHAAALDPSPDEPGKVTALLDQAIAALEKSV